MLHGRHSTGRSRVVRLYGSGACGRWGSPDMVPHGWPCATYGMPLATVWMVAHSCLPACAVARKQNK